MIALKRIVIVSFIMLGVSAMLFDKQKVNKRTKRDASIFIDKAVSL